MWTDEYINIPFKINGTDHTGVDCYRLVVMVYRDKLNIELPRLEDVFIDGTLEMLRKACKRIAEVKDTWTPVNIPKLFDVVLLRTGNLTYHHGIVIDRSRMLHITEGINSTVEKFTGLQWSKRVEGFYRYQK
jgi:cell wall-associated NlpC family hydrolase